MNTEFEKFLLITSFFLSLFPTYCIHLLVGYSGLDMQLCDEFDKLIIV